MKTILFETEGQDNLSATIRAVSRGAASLRVNKIIVFTAHGDGALSLRKKVNEDVTIIAVTFPWQMTAKPTDEVIYIGMPSSKRRSELAAAGVQIVQGVMPFHSIGAEQGDSFHAITSVLDLFGGSAKLCIQAVLMACDAGFLDAGERCIAMTSDTALVARAGHAFTFLRHTSTFAVEQFICKPKYYQITRGQRELQIAQEFGGLTIEGTIVEPSEAIPESGSSTPADEP